MRFLKYGLLGLLALVIVAVAGTAVYVFTLDSNDVKKLLAEQVEKATGRSLKISGPLSYELSWTPKIRVEDVSFQNAAWGEAPEMVRIGVLEADLDLNRVFDGIVIVESLFVEHASVTLERDPGGRANWVFPGMERSGEEDSSSSGGHDGMFPVVESVTLIDVDIVYDDRLEGIRHEVDITSIDLDAPDMENPVDAIVDMSVDGKRIALSGKLPPAVSLGDASVPQPFDITGEAMGEPFKVSGKLLFAYEDGIPANIAIQDLKVAALSSDLSGEFKFDGSGRIPRISAALKSEVIDLRPLEAMAKGSGRGASRENASDGIADMLDKRVPADWLDAAEVSLSLNVKHLKSTAADASDITLTAEMRDGKLSVAPLWAVYAGSPIRLEADVTREGRGLSGRADLSIKGADFDRLAGTAIDAAGFEAGGDLSLQIETSGSRLGELIAGARVKGEAAVPLVRYQDPAGPDAGRDFSISKLAVSLDVVGTEPKAVLNLIEHAGDIGLDTPLRNVVLKGLSGEAHIRAADVSTAQDKVRDLDIAVSLNDEVLSLSIPDMMLARAHLQAAVRIEPAGERTRFSSRVLWKNVDLDIASRRLGIDGRASGRADVDVDLAGEGRTIASILSAIDGKFALDMAGATYLPDGAAEADRIRVETLSLKASSMAEPFVGKVVGRFGAEEIDIAGRFPSLKALVEKGQALPFDITGRISGEKVAVKGQVTLVQIEDRFTSLTLSGLDARIGRSDLTGSVKLGLEGKRPKIDVVLQSDLLDLEPYLDDWMTAGAQSSPAAGGPTEKQNDPLDKPLPVEILDLADGSLDLKAGELRMPGLTAKNLDLRASLSDRVLTVFPSEGILNEGLAKFEASLDGSKAPLAAISLDGTWTGAHFGDVVREYFDSDVISGYGNASLALTASGRTPRETMDTVNGHAAVYMKDGKVSNTYWELIAADLVTSLLPFIGKTADKEGKLNCMATRFDIKDGNADSVVFLVDSSRVTVGGDGTVNLREETVDFLLQPKPKDFSFVSLATPIRISGPMTDPKIYPDPAGAAKSAVLGAGAVALTALNPLALMLPFVSSGSSEDPCPAAIALAEGMSPEEAAKIGAEANGGADKPAGVSKSADEVIKLPGKAVDGIFGGIKKLLE
ncbi:AsmA family protein [Nisaea sediminum]|uniref:AsmA family protein n=1 Tax=Nisaea sediminum TaxID=2775867 RepID=UPI001867E3EF|nr:AsmA family protein [Nisaea sediminum]